MNLDDFKTDGEQSPEGDRLENFDEGVLNGNKREEGFYRLRGFFLALVTATVFLGGSFIGISKYTELREKERSNIFNSSSKLETRTVERGDTCEGYAQGLKGTYPELFGDWSSRDLANRIQGLNNKNNNPIECGPLLKAGQTIYLPNYSQG